MSTSPDTGSNATTGDTETDAGIGSDVAAHLLDYMTQVAEMLAEHTRSAEGSFWRSYEALLLGLVPEVVVVDSVASLPPGIERMEPRNCYNNAYLTVLAHPELTYCEGYAHPGLIPVRHAWCVTAEGDIVDPTWASLSVPATGLAYFGLPFNRAFIDRGIATGRSMVSVFEEDGIRGYPCLKRGLVFDKNNQIADYGDPPPF